MQTQQQKREYIGPHRNNGYWQMYEVDEFGRRGKRENLGLPKGASKRDAHRRFQSLVAEKNEDVHGRSRSNGTIKSKSFPTFEQLQDRYLEIHGRELDKKTLQIRKRTFKLLVQFFGKDKPIRSITAADASDWRRWLETGKVGRGGTDFAEATICKHVSSSKVVWKFAKQQGFIKKNAVKRLKATAPIVPMTLRDKYVDFDRVDAVMKAAPEISVLVGLCYYAGLRTSEAMALQVRHLRPDYTRMVIVPRGGKVTTKQKERVVKIEPELAKLLFVQIRSLGVMYDDWGSIMEEQSELENYETGSTIIRKYKAPFCFRTVTNFHETGRQNMVGRILRDTCDRLKIERFQFKDLRSTRSTIWSQSSDVGAEIAAAWLGHTLVVQQKHYTQVPEHHYEVTDNCKHVVASSKMWDLPPELRKTEVDRVHRHALQLTQKSTTTHK